MLSSIPMLGGVRLTPLPASLLPSTMEVRVPVNGETGTGFADPVTVSNVRLERSTAVKARSDQGAPSGAVVEDGVTGTVYVDAASSAGAFEPPLRSLVSIDGGDEMEVVGVRRCDHFDGTPHHWEVDVR